MGGTNVMAKQAVGIYDSPIMVTAFSMLVGLKVISPLVGASTLQSGVVRVRGQRFLRSILDFRHVAAAGLASGIAVTAVYFAVQRADVVVVSPIVSSSPLVTLFLSHAFLARLEQITPQLVAGTLLAIAGVVLGGVGSVDMCKGIRYGCDSAFTAVGLWVWECRDLCQGWYAGDESPF
ncbi:MAG: hypothetical protein Ct9H300mP11_33170 [Chloroflexota bacterium]|nr:MAG: hypothetical protein Ct9H300mP11_33170 [Chloroflexota bacterium]